MNTILILFLFGLGCAVTVYRGVGMGFAGIYLPVLLLLSTVPEIPMPHILGLGAPAGVMYGIILGLVLRGGEAIRIRWTMVDTLVVVLSISSVITAGATESAWPAVGEAGRVIRCYLGPYFLARIALQSREARWTALKMTIVCLGIIGFFGLIETRLWPYFYGRSLMAMHLSDAVMDMAYRRFGLFRAQVSFSHPIDLGNVCVIAMGILVMLAMTTIGTWRNWYVLTGLAAAGVGLGVSLSFTSYLGWMAMVGLTIVLVKLRWAKYLLVPGVLMGIGIGMLTTEVLLEKKLGLEPGQKKVLEGSLYMRTVIIQTAWPLAKTAGWWGYGKTITNEMIDLDSVDNTYLLFLLQKGWFFLVVWLMVPLALAWRATRAMGRCVSEQQRITLAAGLATTLGMMAAMYTVWFGFAYAIMWFIVLGMTQSVMDALEEGPRQIHYRAHNGKRLEIPMTHDN